MSVVNSPEHPATELLNLHNRLLAADPIATEEIFNLVAAPLEINLRRQFPNLAPSIDPDIYLSAVFDALTDYFKNPHKYDQNKSGLMSYLRLAAKRDLQNLFRKESRHAKGRVSLQDVEFNQSDGNNVSERVADELDSQRLHAKLTQGMTPQELAVFNIMQDGERSSKIAAEALGIGHLPKAQQAKTVKRVKDRIRKRLQRRGLSQS